MAKKYYEIGLLKTASPALYDFETIEYEDDYPILAEARKKAKALSKKCPYDFYGTQVEAISITCHSDEGDELSHYWLHWREFYVKGQMVWHLDFSQ